MKVYAIFANDNQAGISYKMYVTACKAFEDQHYIIDRLLLYEKAEGLPFFRHDKTFMEKHPFYEENKKRFLEANILLLLFPLFWYSVPGILKTWLDMIQNWAYTYKEGVRAEPKHHIKRVVIGYTSMQSKEDLEKSVQQAVNLQLKETFLFLGIPEIDFYHIDNVNELNPKEVEDRLLELRSIIISIKSDK